MQKSNEQTQAQSNQYTPAMPKVGTQVSSNESHVGGMPSSGLTQRSNIIAEDNDTPLSPSERQLLQTRQRLKRQT